MTKKCLIPGCKNNYVPKKKENKVEKSYVKVFRLPRNANELQLWTKSLPYKNLKFNNNSVICMKHWPENYATARGKGNKERPAEPPSVWPGVPPSCVPAPPVPPRPTKKTSLTVRAAHPDEINDFRTRDQVTFPDMIHRVVEQKYEFCCPTISYRAGAKLHIQSEHFSGGVPKFLIQIEESMKFTSFHMGIRVTISSLIKNSIYAFKSLSTVEEAVRFLNNFEESHKTRILHEQLKNSSS